MNKNTGYLHALMSLNVTKDISEYHNAKKRLLSDIHSLKSAIKVSKDTDSQGKMIKLIYMMYTNKVFNNISICLNCIFDKDQKKLIKKMNELGYIITNIGKVSPRDYESHDRLLTTCEDWIKNMDNAFPQEYNEQFSKHLPLVVDRFSYSQINICAIVKLFIECLFDSDAI